MCFVYYVGFLSSVIIRRTCSGRQIKDFLVAFASLTPSKSYCVATEIAWNYTIKPSVLVDGGSVVVWPFYNFLGIRAWFPGLCRPVWPGWKGREEGLMSLDRPVFSQSAPTTPPFRLVSVIQQIHQTHQPRPIWDTSKYKTNPNHLITKFSPSPHLYKHPYLTHFTVVFSYFCQASKVESNKWRQLVMTTRNDL